MENNVEKAIPVVKSNEKSNFPYLVQRQNTENWNTSSAAVTLEAAMEDARAIAKRHPSLPVRIEHVAGGFLPTPMLPAFSHRVGSEKPYRGALWTGVGEPPAVGEKVYIRINQLGFGTVTGYAVAEGYLGVLVQVDEATRPAWSKKSNPENLPGLTFGTELRASLATLYEHWDRFSDTPVSEKDELDETFGPFDKGTPRETVWKWFERQNARFVIGDVQQGIRVTDE